MPSFAFEKSFAVNNQMKIYIIAVLILLSGLTVCAQKQAEVIVASTYLRQSPDAASEKVQTLQKGDKVTFEKTQESYGWYYVSVANRTVKGWIRKDTIQRLETEKPEKTVRANASPKSVKSVPTAAPTPTKSVPIAVTTPANVPSPVPAATPKPAEDEEVIRIETEEVSLKVRVVDEKNRTVKNLNQAQFKVYEDEVLQPITAITTEEVPIINALVIDNSRSLRSQLGKIIEAGKIIVASNLPQDESTVVRFVSKEKIEVVQDFTPNKDLLNNALDNLLIEGGQTAIIDAVYQTAKKVDGYQKSQKKEDAKIRALILVSDGDDRSSFYKEAELFDLLRESQVQIYAVGFINNLSATPETEGISRQQKAQDFLTRLAQETGGKVYFPASIADLPQIAADISREIRTQYLISYTPTNERRDGTFRKIKVVVSEADNGEKRTVITRTGRTVMLK